jgi:hypothetical protein
MINRICATIELAIVVAAVVALVLCTSGALS